MWKRVNGCEIPHACEGRCSGLLDLTERGGFTHCSCWNRDDPHLFSWQLCPWLGQSLFVLVRVFSLWHWPQLRLGHLMFSLRSGCTSPVSCGREPGCIPREDGAWVLLAMGSCGLKPVCLHLPETEMNCYECWQRQRNAHQLRASASLQKANVSGRLALPPALEK